MQGCAGICDFGFCARGTEGYTLCNHRREIKRLKAKRLWAVTLGAGRCAVDPRRDVDRRAKGPFFFFPSLLMMDRVFAPPAGLSTRSMH